MKVSLHAIKQLIDFNLPAIDELVKRVNAQLGGVENIINLGEQYKDALVVKVLSAEKHPNADKLSVCIIDDGGVNETAKRDADGHVQVVCGAPNVRAGIGAIWLPPASVVPSSYGTKQPFVLDAREIRGQLSQGMLAAADELGIGTDHTGIIELTDGDLPLPGSSLQAGASFAKVFGLDDYVIDIENKMFTHRPDLFGQIGVAREMAGIFGHSFEDESWYVEPFEKASHNATLDLAVSNEAGDKVPRLMIAAMDGVKVRPSPMWLQTALVAMGSKPINNVVDITNYMMLMTAQPMHAYDYDKLAGVTIGARMAKKGEKVKLLNSKTYELLDDDIVIVDGDGPIGLAGIMGGSDSEVSDATQRIVLECATFDMYTVRRSSMRHGLFTDALTRFNKGQSMLMNPFVLQQAMKMLREMSGASQAGEVYDDLMKSGSKSWRVKPSIIPMLKPESMSVSFINQRLGLKLKVNEMIKLLENVGFECKKISSDSFSYWAPAWRMDIQDPEDVVEEIGRLYGFEKLPRELPLRTAKPVAINASRQVKRHIRESLRRLGANEVLTYSFVNEKVMQRAEQDTAQAFRLSNALSPDLQYYRLSVLPSLLDKVHMNIKAGHDEFMLYEIGKGHNKKYHAADDDGLPSEMNFVDGVYASKRPHDGAPYYKIQTIVSELCRELGFEVRYSSIAQKLDYPVTAPFDQTRSALLESTNGIFIGMIGELKQSVLKNFKLPAYTAAMTLDSEGLQKACQTANQSYTPLSKYPSITQDISLKIKTNIQYQAVVDEVKQIIDAYPQFTIRLTPLSVYQADDKNVKTISLRLKVANLQKTLKDQEVTDILDAVSQTLAKKIGASRV